jgi:hypothetical protein
MLPTGGRPALPIKGATDREHGGKPTTVSMGQVLKKERQREPDRSNSSPQGQRRRQGIDVDSSGALADWQQVLVSRGWRWGFEGDGTHVRADGRATEHGTGQSRPDGGAPQSEEAEAAPRPVRVSAVGWWNPRIGGWGLAWILGHSWVGKEEVPWVHFFTSRGIKMQAMTESRTLSSFQTSTLTREWQYM